MKKLTKNKIILLVIFAILCVIRYIDSQTLLFVNPSKKAPEGYLSIGDYVLIDSGTKNVAQKINSFSYDHISTSYDYNEDLETTKGISTKSSWEDFVKAYGPYKASYISYHLPYDNPYNEERDYDYNTVRWLTIDEFNQEYIESGRVSIEEYNIYVNFDSVIKHSKVYYTANEIYNADDYGFKLCMIHDFSLSFSYICPDDYMSESHSGYFEYISSSCYSY